MNKIKYGPVKCRADKKLVDAIKPLLEYDAVWWKQGQFSKTKEKYKASFINKSGLFLTGFLPKILKKFPDIKVVDEWEKLVPENKPFLKGITFREDQERLINSALEHQRGILKSPTGSGKTILAIGIMSCFPSAKILFLCHNISILSQTKKELEKYSFKDVGFIGAGKKELDCHICVASIQSFAKLNPDVYCDKFDIVIVDETHHAVSLDSQYGKVLQSIPAEIKLGFTATLPTDKQKILTMEGLLGNVIGDVSIKEGIDKKMLAKPVLKLVPVKYQDHDFRTYADIYQGCIVENKIRNRKIAMEVISESRKGNTSLILVQKIKHGEIILKAIEKISDEKTLFLQGNTENKIREEVKKKLIDKKIKIVICTAIWREGVNIPSLNCIVNACGGKSEIMTLQAIGRGLRIDKGKDKIKVVDFLDPYRYLAEHAIMRINIYLKNKWI